MGNVPLPPVAARQRPRVAIYIDGFNLYYGVLKGTRFKWLDIARFCGRLRYADDIQTIRYFSALVDGPSRPDQETYLKALSTTPLVEVILGKYKTKKVKCKVSACANTCNKWFRIPEEKRTDVNIAIHMLDDAYQDRCEHLILMSGDSDLVPAVQTVRARFPQKKITVYVPARTPERGAAVELRTSAHIHRDLPLNLLPHAQFPARFQDGSGGEILKPHDW